ncbi:MAG: cyclic nucleotide-binding domain-containing protein, partial [Pseudomonadota bacterium]
ALQPGAVLGEIGIFSRERKRMATVVCTTDCELYELTEDKAKQLYFQDRAFGISVLQLIINRLLEDIRAAHDAGNAVESGALAASV